MSFAGEEEYVARNAGTSFGIVLVIVIPILLIVILIVRYKIKSWQRRAGEKAGNSF